MLEIKNRAKGLHLGKLDCSITCNTNGEYGPSPFQAVHDALRIHRDYCLQEAFSHIRAGDHQGAHSWYRDYETITYALDNLTVSLAKQSADNYHAEVEALSPGSYQQMKDTAPARKKEDYALFLKMIVGDGVNDKE